MMRWLFCNRFNWFDAAMIVASVHISIYFGLLIAAIFLFCAGIVSAAGEMQLVRK